MEVQNFLTDIDKDNDMKQPTKKQLIPILKTFTKQSRPILTYGLVKDSTMTMTDLETSIQLHNVDLKNGLHEVVKIELIDRPLDIDVLEYPHINFDDKKVSGFTSDLKTLDKVIQFASKDETRMFLNGVCWNKDELVATDGHILKTIKTDCTNQSVESTILPRTSIVTLIKLLKKFKVVGSFEVIITDSNFRVEIEDCFTLVGRLIQRDYPKYEAIIPKSFCKELEIISEIDFKALKPLLNKRKPTIVLKHNNGNLDLHEKLNGLIFESVAKTIYDDDIGFNADFLKTVLSTTDNRTMKYNNIMSPFVIEDLDEITVIMPMRL